MEKLNTQKPILAASLLMGVTFCVHVLLGGAEIHSPLRASELPTEFKSIISVIWHFVSLQLLFLTVALWHLVKHKNTPLFCFVALTSFGFGALFIFYGLYDLGNIFQMPQWISFWGTTGLMMWGKSRG